VQATRNRASSPSTLGWGGPHAGRFAPGGAQVALWVRLLAGLCTGLVAFRDTHLPFPLGEMAVNLEDVALLFGLPCSGEPMGCRPSPPNSWHDDILARFAGELLAAAASVEAEAQANGGGPSRRARLLHRQRPEGGCPVGLRSSLSDTPLPSRQSEDAIAIHEIPSRTRPTTWGLHRGRQQRRRGRSTRAPTTDEARSYLDLFLNTCLVHYFVCANYVMYSRIQFYVSLHL
jgi:hypothetical protein